MVNPRFARLTYPALVITALVTGCTAGGKETEPTPFPSTSYPPSTEPLPIPPEWFLGYEVIPPDDAEALGREYEQLAPGPLAQRAGRALADLPQGSIYPSVAFGIPIGRWIPLWSADTTAHFTFTGDPYVDSAKTLVVTDSTGSYPGDYFDRIDIGVALTKRMKQNPVPQWASAIALKEIVTTGFLGAFADYTRQLAQQQSFYLKLQDTQTGTPIAPSEEQIRMMHLNLFAAQLAHGSGNSLWRIADVVPAMVTAVEMDGYLSQLPQGDARNFAQRAMQENFAILIDRMRKQSISNESLLDWTIRTLYNPLTDSSSLTVPGDVLLAFLTPEVDGAIQNIATELYGPAAGPQGFSPQQRPLAAWAGHRGTV